MESEKMTGEEKVLDQIADEIDEIIKKYKQTYRVMVDTGKEDDLGDTIYRARIKVRS